MTPATTATAAASAARNGTHPPNGNGTNGTAPHYREFTFRRIGRRNVKTVFTTGQVAKLCRVAARTVSKWTDGGRLPCYRIPPGKDRRITREALIRFLKENNMPMAADLEDEACHKILLVACDALLASRLEETLPTDSNFLYQLACNGFEAGVLAHEFYPDTIIIDLALLGRSEGMQIARCLRRIEQFDRALLVGLASEDDVRPGEVRDSGFGVVLRKPFGVEKVAECVLRRSAGLNVAEGDES